MNGHERVRFKLIGVEIPLVKASLTKHHYN